MKGDSLMDCGSPIRPDNRVMSMKDEIPGDFRSQRTGPANAGLAGLVTNGLRFRFDVWSEVEKNPLLDTAKTAATLTHKEVA